MYTCTYVHTYCITRLQLTYNISDDDNNNVVNVHILYDFWNVLKNSNY